MTLTVIFQALAFLAVTSFSHRVNIFQVLSEGFLMMFCWLDIMAVYAWAKPFNADKSTSKTLTVSFRALIILTITAFFSFISSYSDSLWNKNLLQMCRLKLFVKDSFWGRWFVRAIHNIQRNGQMAFLGKLWWDIQERLSFWMSLASN